MFTCSRERFLRLSARILSIAALRFFTLPLPGLDLLLVSTDFTELSWDSVSARWLFPAGEVLFCFGVGLSLFGETIAVAAGN